MFEPRRGGAFDGACVFATSEPCEPSSGVRLTEEGTASGLPVDDLSNGFRGAATIAAKEGDHDAAKKLLTEAKTAANRTPDDKIHHQHFFVWN